MGWIGSKLVPARAASSEASTSPALSPKRSSTSRSPPSMISSTERLFRCLLLLLCGAEVSWKPIQLSGALEYQTDTSSCPSYGADIFFSLDVGFGLRGSRKRFHFRMSKFRGRKERLHCPSTVQRSGLGLSSLHIAIVRQLIGKTVLEQ
jgi:hypothetical protein